MRVRFPGIDLLARPAPEYDRLSEAAARPWRGALEAGEVIGRGKHRFRVELVGREVLSFARRHAGCPAARRAEAGDREPLGEVLAVVPGVELLLHRGRGLGHRKKEASPHCAVSVPFSTV